ncbi:ADP-ribosylglycohydrolase family protein [Kribbella qitaiheensis]|uniref:ADP-ribosylglycohydrolase family protein n=1 Tax=Kribbella qitaiheensis TaxID=1544730 RepID=UPI0019D60656|nr:ADP-ribosylglycohydrolase family protein [Kribbella qitaiheensis]
MVELAVGDAYGAGFEYADPAFVATHNTVRGYVQHPTHAGIGPGAYTDDTQMTIAVAEHLISAEPWTGERLADRFVTAFRRDRREGYAGGFYRLLSEVQDGAELLARIDPSSDKSGAAMRAGPVGLLPTVADVLHHSAVQARVTHDTPAGIEAAQAAALAVHYCHYELGPLAQLGPWIDRQVQSVGGRGGWSQPWRGKVGAQGWMSVRAAITAMTKSTSLSDILRSCVAFTGDVDTVATVALGAASRSPLVVQDLPNVLRRGLENGPYGRGYLWNLDARLLSCTSPLADPAGPSVVGLWGDDSLFQGATEADRVAFVADGTGWFEHANAFATEVERFNWEQLPAGRIRIAFTRYLYLESGKSPEAKEHWHSERLLTARVGRGTDAIDGEATVLTLEAASERPRRFALVRADVTAAADPAGPID